MRRLFKNLAAVFLIPITRWYLRKERKYRYKNITVTVFPGVFHPGLFASTGLLMEYMDNKIVRGETLLELGSGSGLISVVAAKHNAAVTALDISHAAIANTDRNALANGVKITTVQSDLFANLEKQTFDWVIINPPYYARKPENEADYAWYCGEDFRYFKTLFAELPAFIHPGSKAIMVLTQGCDVARITLIANAANFELMLLRQKVSVFDGSDMLYELRYKRW
jgi:release factor glutamine methyltransferase